MKLKHKSLLAGVISAAIVLPAATQISFANGNIEESIQGRTADYRTITGNDVNFRKGPGTNYSSIAKLNKGAKVEFLGTQGSWTKLKYNGTEGYVHSNYVSTASSSNSEETVKTTKVVTGSSVNLRKGPGTSYTVIKALSRGTKVGYISESNGWAKIIYNGTIGYMSAKYLGNESTQAPSDNNQSSTEETVKSTKVVTGSSVNLRKGPGTSYTVIKALSKGTKVGYISESNGWAKVSYNGTIGYM
ncbi:MAG: SH3 domain-containing protein, partial [Peptostreptococcaceae bacterium]|nr:SH3 domain-containing protein [Peptostreptococcaceae bacterium]